VRWTPIRWARYGVLTLVLSSVGACGLLPSLGPTKRQIFSGSVQEEGDAFIVTVNERVTSATAVVPALGFTESFQNAGLLGSDTIRPGDTLALRVWENVDDPLLGSATTAATVLEEVQVDGNGFIFVPYAGRIKASGNSPDAIRRIITERLEVQTPDPQVEVQRLAGDGSTVSLVGAVGGQGVYPIERPTRTLSTMLAQAGGISIEPEVAQITVLRGGMRGKIWFEDLYSDPHFDIALRAGDRILVEQDTRAFTVMGYAGSQARVPFETQTLSAVEALAQVGGLSATEADPTGVFVLRNEMEPIAKQVLSRSDLIGAQRMVYVLDFTQPNGLFLARDFVIRDDDLIYITEAPISQWNKTIAALTGSLGSVAATTGSLESIARVGSVGGG